ncbi:AsmA-like C-terminal region-containing protein [Rubripirellula tenax]|nr:AsmA-like C-terminal region-containing protein [Rubripirellula tenax]
MTCRALRCGSGYGIFLMVSLRPWFYRLAKAAFWGGLVMLLARNWIAVELVQRIGSRIAEHTIEVEKIHIGFHAITVTRLRIEDEPDLATPLLVVERAEVRLSIVNGIRNGVWAESVIVEAPEVALRFADDGQLATRLPASQSEGGSTATTIPVGQLLVRDAKLTATQVGRLPFEVGDVSMEVLADNEVQVRVNVPDILGAHVLLRSIVDAKTFAGHTQLRVPDFHIDTNHLATLSLAPDMLAGVGISADAAVSVSIHHPANDFDLAHHRASVNASLRNVDSDRAGTLVASMQCAAKLDESQLDITLDGKAIDGQIGFLANVDLQSPEVTTKWSTLAQNLDLRRVIQHFDPSMDAGAIANLTGNGSARFDGVSVSFDAVVDASASEMNARVDRSSSGPSDVVKCAITTASVRVAGSLPIADPEKIQGTIHGQFDCPEFLLAPLARFSTLNSVQQLRDLDGKVAIHGEFASPLDISKIVERCVASGHVTTTDVRAAGLRLQDGDLSLKVTDGIVHATTGELFVLEPHSGEVVARGSAMAQTTITTSDLMKSPLVTRFDAEVVSLPRVMRLVGQNDRGFDGSVAVHASSEVTCDQVANIAAWTADASVSGSGIRIAGEKLDSFVAVAKLRDGIVAVPPTEIHYRSTKFHYVAQADLREAISAGQLQIDGAFTVAPISIGELAKAASRFSRTPLPATGDANARGDFHLTTAPLAFRAEGIANLKNATYAGRSIGTAKLDWMFDETALQLTSRSENFFGGRYVATATMRELDWSTAEVASTFEGVQAAKIAAMLPGDMASPSKMPVAGTISGGARFTSLADLTKLNGSAWFRTNAFSAHDVPVEVQRCVTHFKDGHVSATCNGMAAEGTFQGAASTTISDVIEFASERELRLSQLPVLADFQLNRVSAERLIMAAGLNRREVPIQAAANLTLVRDISTRDSGAICDVVASVEDVRWKQYRLSPLLTANLRVKPDRVVLRELKGQFADGRVTGRAEVRLGSALDGHFEFAATRVNLRRATEALADSSARISGSGDVSIRGRLGRTITGEARLGANHITASGISVPRVRMPLEWSYTLDSNSARWRCRGGVIEAGNGEVRITTDGSYNRNLNVNCIADISRVDTSRLMVGKSAGAGIVDGRVTIKANRATSIQNVSGDFDFELSHVKALEVPVLSNLTQMIKLPDVTGFGSGPTVDGGVVRGRLSGPVIYVDEIALQQSNVQVLVEGRATIDGRLDLNVTASTGSTSPTDGLMSMLDSPLMLAAPAPVALLAKANEAMKDRVVNVHVGGTAARPMMKIQPAKALTQDALRFFLSSTVGGQIADASTRSNNQQQR